MQSWYSANGMLLRKGAFSPTVRVMETGYFNSYITVTYLSPNAIYGGMESFRYVIDHPMEYDTITEKITYQMGLRNGPYSYQQNNLLQTTGFYKKR